MTVKACLRSLRLRTLPLSLSGSIMGIAIASTVCSLSASTVVFLLLTTCFLQILSNLSNELGDCLSGTDAADRQGMHYSVQDGGMTVGELRTLVVAASVCSLTAGALMIFSAFGMQIGWWHVSFAILGICAIVAAMKYTLGHSPYGYRGLGDIFVFIFFGLVCVMGAFCICTQSLHVGCAILPACGIGSFSVAVLNVNNIRDMDTDIRTRKTVAIMMGLQMARIYQTVLILLGWVCLICSVLGRTEVPGWQGWIFVAVLPLYVLHLLGVWKKERSSLDPMLPLLVMSTFLTALLYCAGIIF